MKTLLKRIRCWLSGGHFSTVDMDDFNAFLIRKKQIEQLNWHCAKCGVPIPYTGEL